MPLFKTRLAEHQFASLFLEELGWDRASGVLDVTVDTRTFRFSAVSQKRGLQVLTCTTSRRTLFDRALLRRVQAAVAKHFHEHILIYSCDQPAKQVWQWALSSPDGRRVRHREHPFFSAHPPDQLLARLKGLQFALDKEEDATLVDAIERVRNTLDVAPDLDLFARYPRYAEQSDQLAIAMKSGDEGAFHAFVLFHRPLAKYLSQPLQQRFGLDADEAEQIAFLGLMRAARRFDPERGFQFSTYASYWIRQACQRLGPDAAFLIRVPQHAIWRCIRFRRQVLRVTMLQGLDAAREVIHRRLDADQGFHLTWRRYERVTAIESLSDRNVYREALLLKDPGVEVFSESECREDSAVLREALRQLSGRDATFLRLRNGIDCDPHTLEEIAVKARLTRERVRQIVKRAVVRLLGRVQKMTGLEGA